ncbi:MAG: hypothetical protein NT069_24240, partial [Planctomycetota bacterium]|nr:hypothetical protein [Planctomycetota bacterium]
MSVWLVTGQFAQAETLELVTVSKIQAGLDGWYKVGETTLLGLTANCDHALTLTLTVECPDVDGVPAVYRGKPTRVEPNRKTRLEATFAIGRLKAGLDLSLVDESGKVVWSRRLAPSGDRDSELHPPMRQETPVWLSLSKLPESMDAKPGFDPSAAGDGTASPWIVSYPGVDRLPSDWRGYNPASLVILPTRANGAVGPSLIEGISEAQSGALKTWVEQGGHLLLSLTDGAAYAASPLSKWLPIELDGDVGLQQFSNLESFGGKGSALRSAGRVRIPRVKGLPSSQVPVRDLGGAPIVATIPFGFGRVSIIVLDIEKPPLSDWAALPNALTKLAGNSGRVVKGAVTGVGRKLTQNGVGDLATQWNQTQDDFPEVHRPSYWWILLLILATVVVLGPLDYLLVHRLFRRPELTWITFPVLAAGFVLLGAWWGGDVNGRQIRINQTDVVDIDSASGIARGRSWVSLYNPEHERLQVEITPRPPFTLATNDGATSEGTPISHLNWVGSPENAIGGYYREPGFSSGGQRYSFSSESGTIDNLPVLQWSTRGVRAEWQARVEGSVLTSRLKSNGFSQVTGTITHNLPGVLEDCLLVVGGWAYFPKNDDRSLAPGVAWQPAGGQSRQRELRALLTGERRTRKEQVGKIDGELVTSLAPYDSLGRDPMDILKMISFHQSAGGGEYTGLTHSALRDL